MSSAVAQPTLFGLLSSIGMSPQTEAALLSQLAGSAWTAVVTGRVLPMITPIFMTYLLLPILSVIKSVARTIMFFAITAWLFASLLPVLLAAVGISSAGAFVGRALHASHFPYHDLDVSSVYHNLTSRGLEFLELESDECRQMMACKAGEFVLENYPMVAAVLRNTGFGNMMSSYAKKAGDTYAAETWSVLMGRRNTTCSEDFDECPGFLKFEALFDARKREQYNNSTTPMPTTTTTEMPNAIGNDLVVNAIKSIARSNNSSFLFNLLS